MSSSTFRQSYVFILQQSSMGKKSQVDKEQFRPKLLGTVTTAGLRTPFSHWVPHSSAAVQTWPSTEWKLADLCLLLYLPSWRFMGSYKWGYKPSNRRSNYSYPTYNLTYIYPWTSKFTRTLLASTHLLPGPCLYLLGIRGFHVRC